MVTERGEFFARVTGEQTDRQRRKWRRQASSHMSRQTDRQTEADRQDTGKRPNKGSHRAERVWWSVRGPDASGPAFNFERVSMWSDVCSLY